MPNIVLDYTSALTHISPIVGADPEVPEEKTGTDDAASSEVAGELRKVLEEFYTERERNAAEEENYFYEDERWDAWGKWI